jgi:phospholipid transport system substrate-binding protein
MGRLSFWPGAKAAFVAVIVLVSGSLMTSQASAGPDEAKQRLEELAKDALGRLAKESVSRDEQVRDFREVMESAFDLDLIARFVVGRYWRRADDAVRKEYLQLFRDYMVATYSVRLDEYNGETLQVIGAKATDQPSDVLVETLISRDVDGLQLPVTWRMRKSEDRGYLVTDILVDNVSLAVAQRSEFVSVIRGNGGKLEGLNEKLKARLAEGNS